MSIEHLTYDSRMISSTSDKTDLRGCDLMVMSERILQTLLLAPKQRLQAEKSLAIFSSESHLPEVRNHAEALIRLSEEQERLIASIIARQAELKKEADEKYKRQSAKLSQAENTSNHAIDSFHDGQLDKINRSTEATTWTADAIYESLEHRPRQDYELFRNEVNEQWQEITSQLEQSRILLTKAKISVPTLSSFDKTKTTDTIQQLEGCLAAQIYISRQTLKSIRSRPIILIARNWAANIAIFALSAVFVFVADKSFFSNGKEITSWFAIASGGLLFGIQISLWLWTGSQLRSFALVIAEVNNKAQETVRILLEAAAEKRKDQENTFLNKHQVDRKLAFTFMDEKRELIEGLVRQRRMELQEAATRLRGNSNAQFESSIAAIEQFASSEIEKAHARYDNAVGNEIQRNKTRLSEIRAVETARVQALSNDWKNSRDQIFVDTQQTMNLERQLYPPWSDDFWNSFRGRTDSIGAAKLGTVTIALNSIPGALPVDPDLAWPPGSSRIVHVPIALTFPTRASLLIETTQEGRNAGTAILQETILQILTALPPGQARFTIIDPVGLGEGFAAFMHLADEAEHLIGERIWTDSRHIEQRLTDLCEHMETVIQKFLRNEFADLDQYNQQAGEIAEPYRFLVIADFPTGFTDIAARRLASIVNSGARCGVFTIILRDLRQSLPPEIDIADIRSRSLCLDWKVDRYVVSAEPFCNFPFTPGSMPESEKTIALLQRIALTAKNSKRVQVPFSAIAPKDDALWSESTAQSISIPLGRSGATRLQQITLGVGTSQHALIAGKTGSGKSTLLHALITNLALRYSPDEAELWLIDFKKGVEFRTYATNRLPHARAVAVESDREFGLSVLRGLDAELRRRGEIFRDRSVQDLGGYRRLGASEKIPRTLLVVDEFQELFTEDDKVSEESALLLDRLVRQGRAFGIHVILGSQTLGGAYSIARATMGQMAIRIALQCNEADSQLILSDDNVAARLLSRPGEAIYNDAGGLIEGNNPFQVVWLPDDERDRMLAKVRARNESHPPSSRPPMIVFEGSAPADLQSNQILRAAKAKRDRGEFSGAGLLWFGDAISIKDPTAVILRRQSGTNIMLVGQREDAAMGISAGVIVSLASQYKSDQCQLFLLDGTPPDDENFGRLAGLQERLQISGAAGGLRDAESILEKVTSELLRRQGDHSAQSPTCVVLIHAIHRFRSLRRNEDDFSYSASGDTAPTPDKLLAALLRDGPGLGIHVMISCDGATNLARSFDRNSIREFEWRLLFQVSASDSSTLIDSPIASRLGPQRVILHSEETGTQEKFRPYAWPSMDWIDRLFPRQ